ncbi:MAG: hypothetical protein DMD81_05985, partial [Candidatus Rokuibacteriota bacterium]
LVFDPANSDRLYIANDGGVFTGVYAGGVPPVQWEKVSTGLAITQFYDLNRSAACPTMFGGGCQDNGTVLSSGGRSWRFVHGGDGSYLALHPTDPYTMWVEIFKFRDAMGPTRVEVRRSTDGGYTFARADAGIQGAVDMPVQLLTMDRNNPAVLFAGTDRIFRTANGDAANPATVAWSAASAVIGTISEITIAPSSSLIVYAGTLDGALFQATNGGAMANSFADITPPVAAAPDWPRGR